MPTLQHSQLFCIGNDVHSSHDIHNINYFYKVLVAYSCDIICNDLGVEAYKFILLIYLFSRLYKYYQVAVPFMKLLCNYISCVSCVYNYLCL